MLLVSPLRHEEVGVLHPPAHLKGNDNLPGLALESLAYLGNGLVEQVLVGLVELALVFVGETLVHGAVLHVYVVDERVLVVLVVRYREHVHIGYCVAHDLTLGHKLLQQEIALLECLGLLKLQLLRTFQHPVVYPFAQVARVSL